MITKAIVFDHRGRSKAGQEGPVEVRITYNSKPYYINTDIKVRGRELRDGMIVGRQDADTLNEQLRIVVGRIERAVNRCIEQKIPINVSEIKKQAYNVAVTDASERLAMLNWLNDQVQILNVKEGTRRRYQVLISRLRQYDQLTAWSQLSVEAIYNFDAWLHQLTKVQSNGDIQIKRSTRCISYFQQP
jgi:hypothetical protein